MADEAEPSWATHPTRPPAEAGGAPRDEAASWETHPLSMKRTKTISLLGSWLAPWETHPLDRSMGEEETDQQRREPRGLVADGPDQRRETHPGSQVDAKGKDPLLAEPPWVRNQETHPWTQPRSWELLLGRVPPMPSTSSSMLASSDGHARRPTGTQRQRRRPPRRLRLLPPPRPRRHRHLLQSRRQPAETTAEAAAMATAAG